MSVAILFLVEASLRRLHSFPTRRSSDLNKGQICDVVATAVGGPDRVLIGARKLPGNLVSTRHLHRAHLLPTPKITRHIVRAVNFQRRTGGSAAGIKVKMVCDFG